MFRDILDGHDTFRWKECLMETDWKLFGQNAVDPVLVDLQVDLMPDNQ
jgi:hypothetical protein